jgi:hypothetical protein
MIDRSQHTGTQPSSTISDIADFARKDETAMVVSLGAVSTKAADNGVIRWVSPVAGAIATINSVLNAALATADATITAAIGATPVTGGVLTITNASSAAGDVDSCTPSAANVVAVNDVVTLTVGGGSTGTGTASLTMLITPSA